MSVISSLGIGSGLDVKSLVSDLVDAEKNPAVERLDKRQADYEAELSAYGRLKSALVDLQVSAQGLNSQADFRARKATSGNEDLLSATALGTASAGSYAIEIDRLAQAHKLGSTMLQSDTPVGGSAGDSLQILVGTDALAIDLSSGMNLAAIRDAINGAGTNPGVTAALITGNDDKQALILTATNTGYDDRLQLSFGGTGVETALGMATMNLDASGTVLTDLRDLDAKIAVEGHSLTRGSNLISDVISGITLDLVDASPGTSVSLTVSANKEKASTAISGFVDAYNAFSAVVNELDSYDPINGDHGVLLGDATLRSLQTRLHRGLTSPVDGLSGSANALSAIGITTSSDASLEIDTAKLEQFSRENFENLVSMFAGENGLASRLERIISSSAGAGGMIETRSEGIEATLRDVSEQRETLDRRFQSLEQRYLAQFTAMDALVGQLTSTSEFLTQQLDNLPGFVTKRK